MDDMMQNGRATEDEGREVLTDDAVQGTSATAHRDAKVRGLNGVKLGVCFAVGATIALVVLLVQGVFSSAQAKDTVRMVCDAFFAAGALLLVAGTLVWTFDNGITDGITYSVKSLGNLRRKDYESRQRESYSEYRERKHRNKGSVKEFLIAGASYFLVSVVLLFVYNSL